MAIDNILHNFSAILDTCREQVSRVARCLKRRASQFSKSNNNGRPRRSITLRKKMSAKEEQEGPAVWRNTILLGERCRPLNFSGAIHYDSDGKQTPTPRSPMRSPLPYYTHHSHEKDEVKAA